MDKKKRIVEQCVVTGVFFCILLCLHAFLVTGWGDDRAFAEGEVRLWEFLTYRYQTWTSRVLIEAGAKLLASSPEWVWKVLDSLMLLLLVWIVSDLFGAEGEGTKIQSQIFFFSLLGCLPVLALNDAGWIATTLNYLWPLTLGLVAMRPIKHWLREERCPAWEYPVSPICIIFAANAEQGAALLLGVYLLSGVYFVWKRKRPPVFYVVLLFFTAASVVFILTAPGNTLRFAVEKNQWFPGYDDLSLPQKLLMGFIDSVNYYVSAGGSGRTNYLFALLMGILFAGVWKKEADKGFSVSAVAAFIPLAFYWGIGQFANARIAGSGFERGGHILGLFGRNRCLPTGAGTFEYLGWISYSWGMIFLQAGVYLGLLLCVGMTICFLHGKSFETLLELVILGSGLLTRIIMGFSPTIYASGERTSLYCSVAILIVCLRNLQIYMNPQDGEKRGRKELVLGIYIAVLLCASLWGSKFELNGRERMILMPQNYSEMKAASFARREAISESFSARAESFSAKAILLAVS